MIFHKQLALHAIPKLFCFSPNVRIETADRENSGRHLIEFVQLDLEVRQANREEIIELGEGLFSTVISRIKKEALTDLKTIKRELPSFEPPLRGLPTSRRLRALGRISN